MNTKQGAALTQLHSLSRTALIISKYSSKNPETPSMRCENYLGGQSAESTAASVMKLAHSSSFSMEQNNF